jgi:hypothetical protein
MMTEGSFSAKKKGESRYEEDWPHRDRNKRTLSGRCRTSRMDDAVDEYHQKVEAGETQ